MRPEPAGCGSDVDEYQRLDQRYFGLRVLITDRAEWSTGEIVAAYRGQSRAEAAFRDLKNPGMLAIRCCRIMDRTGQRGRPRVRLQIEQTEPERLSLAEAPNALPPTD